MKKATFAVLVFSLLFFFSCGNFSDPGITNEETFSITRKWYTNADDDRYYFEFCTDGIIHYRYYQEFSSSSNLNAFVTKNGTWRYLDDDNTQFSVDWDDSVECYYNIVNIEVDKIMLEKNIDGPAGMGLGTILVLLKNANNISFIVPEEIVNFIGTWFYNETKDGRYLKFQTDSTCQYHYYQDFGPSSGLTGWVTKNGDWLYNTETKLVSITMNGEISYSYEIELLNFASLKLTGSSSSIINNEGQFYK